VGNILYGCTEHINCTSLQFSAEFNSAGRLALSKINEWNLKERFAAAALDESGGLFFRMDAGLGQVLQRATFKSYLEMWDHLLGLFLVHIGFK
jgi:hypothetical protein